MPRLKCTFRGFIAIIEANGFALHRHDGGSHRRYRAERDGSVHFVDVAAHNLGDEIKSGTLNAMIRQSGLPKKLFRK
ncbi:MAG: type II toxin-antitoxin system HicA family toxin [Pseudomonadota bacterium]